MKPLLPERVLRDVGRRVAELRASRSLTQEALAERMELSTRYVQRVEAGEENLTVGSLVGLANALGAPLSEFFVAPVSRQVRVGRPTRRRPEPASTGRGASSAAAPRPRRRPPR